MATLVLSAVGSIAGPFGTAVGSIIGKEIDSALFGTTRQGPRLKELAVTTSSYGQPIQRCFGKMRVAGSVVWATDLIESSSKEGGKGQPSTTVYTYSASFAVALSSTPISRLGRIWADGNLLRGSNEDLKVEGELRVYHGRGDNPVDPLISADQAELAPAFRDLAYVVFDNLQLADYGNRIPALTFEVFGDDGEGVSLSQIAPQTLSSRQSSRIDFARGFADEGGPTVASLSAIDQVMPLYCVTSGEGFSLSPTPSHSDAITTLPEELASIAENDTEDRTKERAENLDTTPLGVRYYDEERDYQPGVQRAVGLRANGRENIVDIPATMNSDGARQLANGNAQRARWHHERVTWRIATLDPSIQPGSLVKLPETPGRWIVRTWEWLDRGIELNLERAAPNLDSILAGEPGALPAPADLPLTSTHLQFFEVPPDSVANGVTPQIYAAASAESVSWRGAALFSEQGASLLPLGSTGTRRAAIGSLSDSLRPSNATLLEPLATLDLRLVSRDLALEPSDVVGLTAGNNRLLVGDEIVQFLNASDLGDGHWRLSGLLRGRGGTEASALGGHTADTPVTLLDDRINGLDAAQTGNAPTSRIAAIGRGDQEPVYAVLRNAGISRRPLSPVHPRLRVDDEDNWIFCWTRRARGYWFWEDRIEVPLVEETERYVIGFGAVSAPLQTWEVNTAEIVLSEIERSSLVTQHGSAPLWVRQIGTFDQSPALYLATLI
ncbi:MAG: phage tail protein [Pseudomonadota bacterium]